MEKLPQESGVYMIFNVRTGHRYIGGSSNILQRWYTHKSKLVHRASNHILLQKAWNEYGADAFRITVVELCDKGSLVEREQYYLDALKPEYNVRQSADNSIAVPVSPESRKRAGLKTRGVPKSPEHREKIRQGVSGKKRTPEQIERIRAAKKKTWAEKHDELAEKVAGARRGQTPWSATMAAAEANRGKQRSPEVIERIREGQRKRWERQKQNTESASE